MRLNAADLTKLLFAFKGDSKDEPADWVYDADGYRHHHKTMQRRYDDIRARMPRLIQRTIARRYQGLTEPRLMAYLRRYDMISDFELEIDDIANWYADHFRACMEDVYDQIDGAIAPYAALIYKEN